MLLVASMSAYQGADTATATPAITATAPVLRRGRSGSQRTSATIPAPLTTAR